MRYTNEKSTVVLHRYSLPSINGEGGWAIITLGTDGTFTAVSDWGNYGYLWQHHGCDDFREFFTRMEDNADYFMRKLSGGDKVYDGKETLASIKQTILTYRRDGSWSREKARDEWDLLLRYDVDHGSEYFSQWFEHTTIEDAAELRCTQHKSDLVAFVEKALSRLSVILKAELKAEAEAVAARLLQADLRPVPERMST